MTYQASVHGVSMLVESRDKGFMAFLSAYFAGFPAASGKADVACSIEFLSGYTWNLRQEHRDFEHTLGSGIGWDEAKKTLCIEDREWTMTFSESEGAYLGKLSFRKNAWKHAINILSIGGKETRRRYYRAAARLLPQELVFMQLEKKGIEAHSGAAVSMGGKAYMLAGLPGSGKSTLARMLKKNLDADILTENFVLTDGVSVFPFPEGNILSSTESRTLAGAYVLTHGKQFHLAELSKDQARRAIEIIDALTAELPRHSKLSAWGIVGQGRREAPADRELMASAYALTADHGLAKTKDYFASL